MYSIKRKTVRYYHFFELLFYDIQKIVMYDNVILSKNLKISLSLFTFMRVEKCSKIVGSLSIYFKIATEKIFSVSYTPLANRFIDFENPPNRFSYYIKF